jgi:hypothetical protein
MHACTQGSTKNEYAVLTAYPTNVHDLEVLLLLLYNALPQMCIPTAATDWCAPLL